MLYFMLEFYVMFYVIYLGMQNTGRSKRRQKSLQKSGRKADKLENHPYLCVINIQGFSQRKRNSCQRGRLIQSIVLFLHVTNKVTT